MSSTLDPIGETMPSFTRVVVFAGLYVVSGVTQPLLMEWATHAGLADPRCQLYMLFYYLGPALVALTLHRRRSNKRVTPAISSASAVTQGSQDDRIEEVDNDRFWPERKLLVKAAGIALLDIFAQTQTYTGNNLAGPAIFSILYSSVTVWAPVYSQCFLSRVLNRNQWIGVICVFLGLALTAFDSLSSGSHVFVGSCLILVGSSFHGLCYVLSESLMTTASRDDERIHVRANCAMQGIVACSVFLIWHVVYVFPRWDEMIGAPMRAAGTTPGTAAKILLAITVSNLVHSLTFFHTLKYFPGGATSAGVLKGLQAVLVFTASSVMFCGRWGGSEMCFTGIKFASLVVVVGGILLYARSTEKKMGGERSAASYSVIRNVEAHLHVQGDAKV